MKRLMKNLAAATLVLGAGVTAAGSDPRVSPQPIKQQASGQANTQKRATPAVAPAASIARAPAVPAASKPVAPVSKRNPDDLRLHGDLKQNLDKTGFTNDISKLKGDRWNDVTGGKKDDDTSGKSGFIGGRDPFAHPPKPQELVTGKYADTYQGERLNGKNSSPFNPETAGHGGHGRNPFTRGRGDQESTTFRVNAETDSPTVVHKDEKPATSVPKDEKPIFGWSPGLDILPHSDAPPKGDDGTKTPTTDGDTGGPVVFVRDRTKTGAKQLAGVVIPRGTNDGPGLNTGNKGGSRFSSISTEWGANHGSDKEVKKAEAGKISFEAALKQANFTNPGQR